MKSRSFHLPQSLQRSVKGRLTKSLLNRLNRSRLGRTLISMTTRFAISQVASVVIRGTEVKYSTLEFSWLKSRFEEIENLEPTTLTWIDQASPNVVLWDIGANVGSYSIYAALAKQMTVVAFEPSPFNIEFLSRNIWLNGLESKIAVFPNPLSDKASQSRLSMKSIEWGNSGSTFGELYAEDGKPMNVEFEYQTVGFSMDQAMTWFGLEQPNYVKLDVDGIEGLILSGGSKVLKRVESLLVEVPEFESGRKLVETALSRAGLKKEKSAQHNEIWTRT